MGTARALLIGGNAYPGAPLRGCLNDLSDVAAHLIQRGFREGDITLHTDADLRRGKCIDSLKRLRDVSRSGDVLFCQNSSHGDRIPSLTGEGEPDGLDEVICMIDYNWDRDTSIVDDDLHDIFSTLDPGVLAYWVADSCHSGTLERAVPRWTSRYHPAPPPGHPVHAMLEAGHKTGKRKSMFKPRADERHAVSIISGCGVAQTSADAEFDGRANGALTYHLLRLMKTRPELSVREIVKRTRAALAQAGYSQRPELKGQAAAIDQPFFGSPSLLG